MEHMAPSISALRNEVGGMNQSLRKSSKSQQTSCKESGMDPLVFKLIVACGVALSGGTIGSLIYLLLCLAELVAPNRAFAETGFNPAPGSAALNSAVFAQAPA